MKAIEIHKTGAITGCLAKGVGGIDVERACRPNLKKYVTGGNNYS